jgi:hypothetical protein
MKNRVRKSRSIGIIVFLSQRLPIGSEPDERVTVFGQRAPIDSGGRVGSALEARRARRYRETCQRPARVSGFEIDDQLEFGWVLDREFAWARAPENFVS